MGLKMGVDSRLTSGELTHMGNIKYWIIERYEVGGVDRRLSIVDGLLTNN